MDRKKIKLQPRTGYLAWVNQKVIPELRIAGNWLADHGFKASARVEITIRQNQLTIKPLP